MEILTLKTSTAITLLLIWSIITGAYIRYNVIANMQDAYIEGCYDAAKKNAIDYNDLHLYDFCSNRASYLHESY